MPLAPASRHIAAARTTLAIVGHAAFAELTEEVTLEGDAQNVVHRKTRIIFADSPQQAYEKALTMITEHEIGYLNEHRKTVRTRFWGLREMNLSNEDMDRAGMLPESRLGSARRRTATGLSPPRRLRCSSGSF